jgi:DNA-binding HxlR family transcriptional regulator
MLRNDYEGQVCSIARSLELIGERWTILVIREVFNGHRKFSEMQRSLGVARNVLADRLDGLVEEGILERRPYSDRPARYEYFLTEKGLDLWPVMVSLLYWGDKHMPLPGGPPSVIVHKGECGGTVNDRRVCEKCGKELNVREARAVEGPGLAAALESLETAA